mmetsp:Transcript_48806/g.99662  ORF Transcript_48806/g.99662 Transcript_48806/m.99662 type:complete len:151 (+) Transcript_48806:26-478(+)|eukprot:CAMPEP_0181325522 /NCGR_PEP_ID=MMETSP1101-20121128/20978_1 /TAXON_ID=46948 /ORGANISM="Rhodomonas abbreviata, Strain Caron Lab Isolate" /LENGTH=150 /DNA_ID=CAMNT_0023433851 /DNA_START=19 /DNA_END=471 /DNA_ORIENTATION=+
MGTNASVPQVRAKDVKRVCDKKSGWLCKRGLTNTASQKRWCAIHDLHLYYYESPRSEEPKGVVNLRGAIVSISKRAKLSIEIETGALISEKGTEKRTYVFSTLGAEERARGTESKDPEEAKRIMMTNCKVKLEEWKEWLQEETAKTFTPA